MSGIIKSGFLTKASVPNFESLSDR